MKNNREYERISGEINLTYLGEEDVIILRELQEDGRISYAELSRKTRIPDSTIYDKIKKLISRGVIKKFAAIIDQEKVGLNAVAIIGVETGAKLYKKVAETLSARATSQLRMEVSSARVRERGGGGRVKDTKDRWSS